MNLNGTSAAPASSHPVRRWPLVLIAAPAAVAIWSGWVGLGAMCGFGLVQLLPGIVSWHLDTAITLPVGVEAYGAYALGVWVRPAGVPQRARSFAKRSAVGALALGMGGQVIYHLLAAAHRQAAPWPVTMLVACLPVAVLGFGAGLTHLLRAGGPVAGTAETTAGQPEPAVPETATVTAEPRTRDALLLELILTGSLAETADFLGVPKSRVARWKKRLTDPARTVPGDVPGEPAAGAGPHPDWDALLNEESARA